MTLNLESKVWPQPWRKDPVFLKKARHMVENAAEVYQRQFVSEGTLLALPLCFPGQTDPIPYGECAITALTTAPNGVVYGVTSGRHAHLICAMLRGATGYAISLGRIENGREAVAVGVGCDDQVYIAVNSEDSGSIVRHAPEPMPFDCVQEWFLHRRPFERVGEPFPGKRLCDAMMMPDEHRMLVLTEDGLLATVDLESNRVDVIGQIDPLNRFGRTIVLDAAGQLFGTGCDGRVWTWHSARGAIEETRMTLPCGAGRQLENRASVWAVDPSSRRIYGASEVDGTLFCMEPDIQRIRSLGCVLSGRPVHAMAVTNDGRVYGMAGGKDDIARMFMYDPVEAELRDLGVCVSTLTARTYGFVFKSATRWENGTLLFGEADHTSHLWMYFPALKEQGGSSSL